MSVSQKIPVLTLDTSLLHWALILSVPFRSEAGKQVPDEEPYHTPTVPSAAMERER
jgi:hypothetical protein